MTDAPPIWITEANVVSLMDMSGAIRALEAGLRAEARGAAVNMTKTHADWTVTGGSSSPAAHATLHAIGAAFPEAGRVGTKTWAHTPGGATPLLVLFDAGSGALRAIIEAFALGQMRTGSASGLATNLLAREDADDLAIVGTGKQMLTQVAAVQAVRPLKRVRIFGRDPDRRRRAVGRVRDELGLNAIDAPGVAEAVRDAPIVTVVTRAREPFLSGEMVARGAHINAVGAIVPAGAEVGQDLLARCSRVVVDSPPAARALSQELIQFCGAADRKWAAVRRLADVVAAGERRTPTDDLTLFKSLGMGISDLALGIDIERAARNAGMGRPLASPERAQPRLRAATEDTKGTKDTKGW